MLDIPYVPFRPSTADTSLRAFHRDPAIKARYLARVHVHQQQQDFTCYASGESAGAAGWRGRPVECTVHDHQDPYTQAAAQLGVLAIVAQLEDALFEWLPEDRAQEWPVQFLQVIPVGAVLDHVWPVFARWLLGDETWGVVRFARTTPQREAIQHVSELMGKRAAGEVITLLAWQAASAAAAAALATASYASEANALSVAAVLTSPTATSWEVLAAAIAAAQTAASEAAEATGAYTVETESLAAEAQAHAMADYVLALLAAAPAG